ncbi:N-acetylmuramoyl-L-alanine amidase [Lutibacter sp. B2]|nr:N-acetylmuramoyl-L-alanine amidase [Lutibacter sp. B2]
MSKPILIIDAGHGGKDSGGGSNKYWLEKNFSLKISLYQHKRFKELGLGCVLTRDVDKYLNSIDRTNIVKSAGAKYCISNHLNSGGGVGAETIHSIHNKGELAKMILNEIVNTGQVKRRVFTKTLNNSKDIDYYYMHRLTGNVETVIIEYGFADHKEDTMRLLENWEKYAEAVVKAICKYTGTYYKEPDFKNHMLIQDQMESNVYQMQQWAKNNKATSKFVSAALFYIKYGELTGIRGDVLYSQSAKETGFGRYMGNVSEDMNNFAGIKIKRPTGDEKYDHESFLSMDDGVRAHFNHVAAYIGTIPIGEPHDRYYVVNSMSWAGTIRYVEQLGGKWAPNINYGKSIINDYLEPLLQTDVYDSNETGNEHWALDVFNRLNSAGITVHEKRFDDSITRGEAMALVYNLYKVMKNM